MITLRQRTFLRDSTRFQIHDYLRVIGKNPSLDWSNWFAFSFFALLHLNVRPRWAIRHCSIASVCKNGFLHSDIWRSKMVKISIFTLIWCSSATFAEECQPLLGLQTRVLNCNRFFFSWWNIPLFNWSIWCPWLIQQNAKTIYDISFNVLWVSRVTVLLFNRMLEAFLCVQFNCMILYHFQFIHKWSTSFQ